MPPTAKWLITKTLELIPSCQQICTYLAEDKLFLQKCLYYKQTSETFFARLHQSRSTNRTRLFLIIEYPVVWISIIYSCDMHSTWFKVFCNFQKYCNQWLHIFITKSLLMYVSLPLANTRHYECLNLCQSGGWKVVYLLLVLMRLRMRLCALYYQPISSPLNY